MHFNIHHIIAAYGYPGLFIGLVLEYLAVPVPAETVIMLSGVAWGKGTFLFVPLLLVATMGTMTGSLVAYAIGRLLGRTVVLRAGNRLGITEEKLKSAERQFDRYTVPILLFSRFIPGVRVLIPYVAGINRTSLLLFTGYSAAGSLVWCVVFLLIGRFLRKEWKMIHHTLGTFSIVIVIGIILLVIVYIVLMRIHRRKRENN